MSFHNKQPCVAIRKSNGNLSCYCEESCIIDNVTGLVYPLMSFDESCGIKHYFSRDVVMNGHECWCPMKRELCSVKNSWWNKFVKMIREYIDFLVY